MEPKIEVKPWKRSRFWAVYINSDLVCVTVYKTGAENVAAIFQSMFGGNIRYKVA